MTDQKAVWRSISTMENDLADVDRWGKVLESMGTSDHVHTEAVFVVSRTLQELAERLGPLFEAALKAAREPEAPQCA